MTDRHLTKDEQKAMHRALRRSTKPVDLRAKSDALLKQCGWAEDRGPDWWNEKQGMSHWSMGNRPHPYANAQDAIDLFMAKFPDWRMFVEKLPIAEHKMWSVTIRPHGQDGFETDWCFTLAEAICAAIEEAVKC